LYDALLLSLDKLKGIEDRRVVLVFADGDDTASHIGLGAVIDRARADEDMVYSIGLESNYFIGQRSGSAWSAARPTEASGRSPTADSQTETTWHDGAGAPELPGFGGQVPSRREVRPEITRRSSRR
jgi:hypothetical protein